jgi:hypothetical protein
LALLKITLNSVSVSIKPQYIVAGFQVGLDKFKQAFRDLNRLALGKAQLGLKAFHDVGFRQDHEGGSVLAKMEFKGRIKTSSQKLLFLSRVWCGLTFSPLRNKASLGIQIKGIIDSRKRGEKWQ